MGFHIPDAIQMMSCAVLPSNFNGCEIGSNGFLPRPDLDENVGWHMQRVDGRRRYLRVFPGCWKRTVSQSRFIVSVNNVVGNARVFRIFRKDFLQNGTGFVRVFFPYV